MTREAIRRTIVLLVATAGLSAVVATTSPRTLQAQVTPPPVAWGARPAAKAGETEAQALAALQTSVGQNLRTVRVFTNWEKSWPDSYANNLAANDQIVLLSVKPKRNNGTVITWRSIADALPGSQIHNEIIGWAAKVKNFPDQMYFIFHHEPEASANLAHGTATDFKDAWRKVVQVFQTEGVSNAKYLWTMTDYSFWAPATERRAATKWYPGDAWVDAIGADSYNWYTCRGVNEGWRTLERIITPLRDFGVAHPDEELWLPEFASIEDPANPLRKAQWLADAQELLQEPGWEQFKGVSYFHTEHNNAQYPLCDWWVDTSPESLAAFTAMGDDPHFGGDGGGIDPDPEPTILYVVSNPVAPTAGDNSVLTHLETLNVAVTLADDDTVTAAEAAAKDVVLISSSVNSALGARLRDVATPIVVWKPWIYDDMKLTGTVANVDYANLLTQSLTIVDPGHPAAGGATGSVSLFSNNQSVGVGIPNVSASVVANVGGSAGLFVYEAGESMIGGFIAPGCRIAFPSGTSAMAVTSPAGWALFGAAVSYAVDRCEVGPPA